MMHLIPRLVSCAALTAAFLLTPGRAPAAATLALNANGNGALFDEAGIDALGKTWIRIFIPIFDHTPTSLRASSSIQNFKTLAAKSKYKATLSIKWDFKGKNLNIPDLSSTTMRDYVDAFEDLLDYLGTDIDKLVVGNEPMFETKTEDRAVGSDGKIPQVEFYKRLANVAKTWRDNHPDATFEIFVGAFNRLELSGNKDAADVKALIGFAKNTTWVAGIDIHAHHSNNTDLGNNFANGRSLLGASKQIISTEWSLVGKWALHLDDPIGATFANAYPGNNASDTLLEYINRARVNRVPKAQWDDLFRNFTWWVKTMPKDIKTIMSASNRNVGVANHAFKQEPINVVISADKTPWYLNGLYQEAFLTSTNTKHAFIWQNFKDN